MEVKEVKEYSFTNGDYSFSLLNLGCALTSLCGPDREGKCSNVLLHYHNAAGDPSTIFDTDACFGLTVGRFANRIGGASFSLKGKTYKFEPNNGPNFLHSGKNGLRFKFWDIRKEQDGFTCLTKATEEEDGFPGTVDARVRFSLSAEGLFRIHYSISCTEDCPINFTNHAYFNLSGEAAALSTSTDNAVTDNTGAGHTIYDHLAQFNSSRILVVDDGLIPTGDIISVEGTAWDFRTLKPMGQDIKAPELASSSGYDHAYVIDRLDGASRGFTQFAKIYDPASGRTLTAFTDLPAFHFYTGNFIRGEEGYVTQGGFCLETEFYPDCVNKPQFPSCILKAGDLFESTTVYHLSRGEVKNERS